jgi:hypothetical protein
MFNRYHGYINPLSNNKKTNKQLVQNDASFINNKSPPSTLPSTPTLPVASGLPIITIPEEPPMFPANPNFKLPNFNIEDYKDILEPKQEIKYILPEIIPKEKESIQSKQYIKPDFEKKESRQYIKQLSEKIPPKQYIKSSYYNKPISRKTSLNKKPNFSSLDKYKINIDNQKFKTVKVPEQKKYISIRKEFPIKTPEIIEREKYIKSKLTIKKKPISKTKLIQKPKTIKKKLKSKEIVNDALSKIEMSDLDYKKKFEKLKKVYLKQHDSLINVFDGYQKLYEKVKEEKQIK